VSGRTEDLLVQPFHQQLEVSRLDAPFSRRAHDVVEERSQFENFESAFAKVAVPADVAIVESENVAELVGECLWGQVPGTEGDVASNGAVREFRARGENPAVSGKARDMLFNVDVLAV